MFRDVLGSMAQVMAAGLEEKRKFLPLWYKEWFELLLRAFEPGAKVVYTSIYAFPMELLWSFDVACFDFEIAGALMTTMNHGLPLMEAAEEQGYSPDICSFHRAGLGGFFRDWFPRPDLLLTTSFYCEGKAKTNDIVSSMTGARAFCLDVPQEVTREGVRYVAGQLEEAAGLIGEVAGQRLDMDRLRESVRSSNRSRRLQLEILELLKTRPCPMKPQDMIAYSINGNLFLGSPVMEELNGQLATELRGKIAKGPTRPERHRIFWFAWMPIYPCNVFDVLREHQVGIALCENFRMYWDELDEDNPFEALALRCLNNPYIGRTARRLEGLDRVVDEYGIDGALLFATPACRHSKSAHMLLKDAVTGLGRPFLMLDMDIADSRGFQPEQVRTRIEGFVEVMDGRC